MRDIRAVTGDRIEVLFHAIPTNQLQVRSQIDRATARRRLDIGAQFVFEECAGIEWARDPKRMVKRVTDLISKLGLNDAVLLVDALDHPELYYAASDVLLAPFESVRFSSANLVEAMAYGRPHIVSAEPAAAIQ